MQPIAPLSQAADPRLPVVIELERRWAAAFVKALDAAMDPQFVNVNALKAAFDDVNQYPRFAAKRIPNAAIGATKNRRLIGIFNTLSKTDKSITYAEMYTATMVAARRQRFMWFVTETKAVTNGDLRRVRNWEEYFAAASAFERQQILMMDIKDRRLGSLSRDFTRVHASAFGVSRTFKQFIDKVQADGQSIREDKQADLKIALALGKLTAEPWMIPKMKTVATSDEFVKEFPNYATLVSAQVRTFANNYVTAVGLFNELMATHDKRSATDQNFMYGTASNGARNAMDTLVAHGDSYLTAVHVEVWNMKHEFDRLVRLTRERKELGFAVFFLNVAASAVTGLSGVWGASKLLNAGAAVDPSTFISVAKDGIGAVKDGANSAYEKFVNGYNFKLSALPQAQRMGAAQIVDHMKGKLADIEYPLRLLHLAVVRSVDPVYGKFESIERRPDNFEIPVHYHDNFAEDAPGYVYTFWIKRTGVYFDTPVSYFYWERFGVKSDKVTTPVVLDLSGEGMEFVALHSSAAAFDVDGDGTRDRIAWIKNGTALLALDSDRDRAIDEINEINFRGYTPGARTDLEGLRAFDTNRNATLDPGDLDWNKFGAWVDRDGDGICDPGEFKPLDEMGIKLIDLTSNNKSEMLADRDVTVFGTTYFQWADGRRGTVGDVSFTYRDKTPLFVT